MADSGRPDNGNNKDKSTKNPAPANNTPRQDGENPFVAFRRYADEQFSSLLRSVIGLPSMFTPPSTRDWMAFREEDRSRQFQRKRQEAEEGSGEHSGSSWSSHEGPSEGSSHAHQDAVEERRRAFAPVIFDSALDNFWPFDPSPSFGSFSHVHPPLFFDFPASSGSIGWPFSYLMFSPYSPLHLEHQQRLRRRADRTFFAHPFDYLFRSLESLLASTDDRISDYYEEKEDASACQWRLAFEDLLRIENGQPMLDYNTQLPKKESAEAWFASMINRGSLGDNWKHVKQHDGDSGYFSYNNGSIQRRLADAITDEEETDSRDKLTELDLYDAFLRKASQSDDEEEDITFPMSPILSAIHAEQRRNRQELENSRKKWDELPWQMDHVHDHIVDVYNRDESVAAAGSEQDHPSSSRQVGPNGDTPQSSASIVSTMTSVNRRTLPDGSIETKTVRTKRFADGTEESNETVHVENRDRQITTTNAKPDTSNTHEGQNTSSGDRENARTGWFWKD